MILMAEPYVPQVSCPLCLIASPAMEMVPVTIDRTLEGQPKTVLLCQACIGEVDYSAQTWRAVREQLKQEAASSAGAEISEASTSPAEVKADET